MYRVTIEAESADALTAEVRNILSWLTRPAPEVVSEKKPVGRPRKAPEPVAEAPKAEPAPAPKAEKPKKYTLDQVRSALQTYAHKVDPDASVGILKVRELLAQYQSTKHVPCQKISEVQDQDYAALVAACGA